MDIDPQQIGRVIVLMIPLALLLAGLYYVWGLNSGTPVQIGNYAQHNCQARISSLAQDYGDATAQDNFFLQGNDLYILNFNSSWRAPFSGQDCRIIEDDNMGKTVFHISYVKKELGQLDPSFFTSTRDCINVAGAKGASNTCELTGMGKQIMDFPVTQLAVTLPTQDSQSLAKALAGRGWGSSVRQGVELVKYVDENFIVLLNVVDDTSCSLKDTPKKAIWDLADNGNQLFTKAKQNQFDTDTVPKLIATSELIISFEGLNVELSMPTREAPKDAVDIPGYAGQLLIDAASYGVKVATQATLDTATVLSEPQCKSDSQVAKFQAFEANLKSQDFIVDYGAFDSKLVSFKSGATIAMQEEKSAREKSAPSQLGQFFWIKKVIQYYAFESSQSQQLFDEQLYVSAKTAANLKAEYYANYWNNISTEDIVLSVVIWGILIGVVFVIGALLVWAYFRNRGT